MYNFISSLYLVVTVGKVILGNVHIRAYLVVYRALIKCCINKIF